MMDDGGLICQRLSGHVCREGVVNVKHGCVPSDLATRFHVQSDHGTRVQNPRDPASQDMGPEAAPPRIHAGETENFEPLLVSPKTAAQLLDISRSRVFELMASGQIPSVTLGRSRRIRLDALRAWIDGLT